VQKIWIRFNAMLKKVILEYMPLWSMKNVLIYSKAAHHLKC